MSSPSRPIKCRECGALVATVEADGFTIKRQDLHVVIGGQYRATVRCRRPTCRHENLIIHSDDRVRPLDRAS
jgi:hypothetical protein